MKQFLVTGVLIAPEKINDELLQTHMAYTQQWMDAGRIVMSALYADMTGVVTLSLRIRRRRSRLSTRTSLSIVSERRTMSSGKSISTTEGSESRT